MLSLLTAATNTAEWMARGACVGEDPELFFPVGEDGAGDAPPDERTAVAKEICADCPVAVECLKHAVEEGEPSGIWGGTTPQERRLLRASGGNRAAVTGATTPHPRPEEHEIAS